MSVRVRPVAVRRTGTAAHQYLGELRADLTKAQAVATGAEAGEPAFLLGEIDTQLAGTGVRCTVSRAELRQVVAATQWPTTDRTVHPRDAASTWSPEFGGFVDQVTGGPLPTWDEALDGIDDDPEAQPVHVIRFGPSSTPRASWSAHRRRPDASVA
ncbi:hypothetical protein [Streptomyces sp. TLI_053]|uniref:hypothetical protein n=1 Tax=Streptomyces sp. TLI_053 TaxID=1855352 RepID=UPI0013520D37|nr:hypothetical protein [Streptomyces sp. TLI_053]